MNIPAEDIIMGFFFTGCSALIIIAICQLILVFR